MIRSWKPFLQVVNHLSLKMLHARDSGKVRTVLQRLRGLQSAVARVISIAWNLGYFGSGHQVGQLLDNPIQWYVRFVTTFDS